MISNKYIVFAKVAETGNITKAATELNYTQPGISQIITNMEKEYGFPLVIRSKTGVTLTENGKKILVPIQKILKWERVLEQRQKNILGLMEGSLKISTFISVHLRWLPPLIAAFTQKYPHVTFEITHGDYDSIQADLLNDQIDCGFLTEGFTKDVHFISLLEDEFFVVLPKDNVLTKCKQLSLEKLADQPLIIPGEGKNYDFGRLMKKIPHPRIKLSTQDDYAAVAMVAEGLGITLLPRLVLDTITADVECRSLSPAYQRTIGIAVHTKQYASPLALEFVNFTTSWVRENAQGLTRASLIKTD